MIALIIGIISLVIILAVIGVNIYMMIVINRNSSDIKGLKNDKDEQMNKINQAINNKINVLDLAEFKDLDPYLKDAYKRYIVNILSSGFMKAINKTASDNDINSLLKKNQNEMDNIAYSIAKELQTNGFASLAQTPVGAAVGAAVKPGAGAAAAKPGAAVKPGAGAAAAKPGAAAAAAAKPTS